MNESNKRKKFTSLIVFARYPHPGKVKTRLAQTIGDKEAALFYDCCAKHILDEIKKIPTKAHHYLFCADTEDINAMRHWGGEKFSHFSQSKGDLGKRMKDAFSVAFDRGAGKAIIVGTDVPDLSANIIQDAIDSLDTYDVVMGPSYDGGYYLLGIKKLHESLFESIDWSTNTVFQTTLDIIGKKGLKVYRLPKLRDVDVEPDLLEWMKESDSKDGDVYQICKSLIKY